MPRRRAGELALAVAFLLLACLTAWATPATALTQTANVVARNAAGRVLPADPLLNPGDRVFLTVTGFGANARLGVRLGTTSIGTYQANSHGSVTFEVTVPRSYGRGSYVVAAVGGPPLRTVTPTPVRTNATHDPQIVEAIVPTLGLFVFRLDPGGSTSPTHPSSPSHPSTSSGGGGAGGTSGSQSGQGGHLGSTGVDSALLLLIAAAALVGGLLIMWPGRRRKHA